MRNRRGPGRPANDHLQARLGLLETAQAAFARQGFEGASLRQIAGAAGVDAALVAHHFGSKDKLWEAVVERLTERREALTAALVRDHRRDEVPIRTRLKRAIDHLTAIVCEEPDFGLFISRATALNGEKLDFLISRLIRPYHDALCPLLLEAMREGVIERQPVEPLYFMLVQSVTMTVAYRHVLGKFDPSLEDIAHLKKAVLRCLYATVLNPIDGRRPRAGHIGAEPRK